MKIKRAISILILFSLLLPLFIAYPTKKAEAQVPGLEVPVGDALARVSLGLIATGVGTVAATQTFFNSNLWTKEYVLDLIAYAAADAAIQIVATQLQNMIINAANSFAKNLKKELTDLENKVADTLGVDINSISSCFPTFDFSMAPLPMPAWSIPKFKLNITCTLTEANKMDAYYQPGGFTWDEFEKTTFDSERSTPFGSYIYTQGELNRRTQEEKDNELRQLDWGRGYRGIVDGLLGGVKTPAAAIQHQLDEAFSTHLDKMKNADELTEVLVAIVSSLTQQAITGTFGF